MVSSAVIRANYLKKAFFIVLIFLIFDQVLTIYDPGVTTIKPPSHRESLPWYLSGQSTPTPFIKLQQQHGVATKSWSNWKKSSDDSEITSENYYKHPYYQRDVNNGDGRGLFDNLRRNYDDSGKSSDYLRTGVNQQNNYHSYNKYPKKARKEAINVVPSSHQSSIAIYDEINGVHCPYSDATGQFVYPPDCAFFVNCWKGRAFVQPCSPGTNFNPETLECDYPHKVKCYGGELADFIATDYPEITDNQESLHEVYSPIVTSENFNQRQDVQCPEGVTSGLFPHSSDCTKFIQCINGAPIIQNCGIGTVFNPIDTNCDFPSNVKGCEDAIKTKNDFEFSILTPPKQFSPHSANDNRNTRRLATPRQINQPISCPTDYSGILPHPNDCKKFLQCNQGITYIMDCGPGTVFNPITSICDWLHKTPECENNSKQHVDIYHKNSYPNQSNIQTENWQGYDNKNHYPNNYDGTGKIDVRVDPSNSQENWNKPTEHKNSWNQQSGFEIHKQPEFVKQQPCQYPNCPNQQSSESSQGFYPHYSDQENHNNPPFNSPQNHEDSWGQPSTNIKILPSYPVPSYYPNRTSFGRTNLGFLNPEQGWKQETNSGNIYVNKNFPETEKPNIQNSRENNNKWNQGVGEWRPNSGPFGDSQQRPDEFTHHPSKEPEHTKPQEYNPSPSFESGGKDTSSSDRFDLTRPNAIESGDKRWNEQEKIKPWGVGINIFNQGNPQVDNGTKILTSTIRPGPSGIYVNINGTRGHYITKEVEIQQGHSNTRNQNSSNYPGNRWIPTRNKTHLIPHNSSTNFQDNSKIFNKTRQELTTPLPPPPKFVSSERPSRNGFAWTKPDTNVPTVSIEEESNFNNHQSESTNTNKNIISESDIDKFDIDVLDVGNTWKPHLIFENKTKNNNDSVTMKVDTKNNDVDIFNVEYAPWREEEPVFPVYFIPPVHSLGQGDKPMILTPLSGQSIRLRGGTSSKEGYLEVQGIQPGWGIVCDTQNGWTLKEAHIVCRQLGYTRGAETIWQGRNKNKNIPNWIATTSVHCQGNETKFQKCQFTHGSECNIQRDAVGISCLSNRLAYCDKDEIPHGGNCYHLANPDSGLNHAEALGYCIERNSRLVDIVSQNENNFLSEWLINDYPKVESVMTAGVGFTMMSNTFWIWEDSSKAMFKFSKWWPGWKDDKKIPPLTGLRPTCIVMKNKYPCHDRPDENCTADYFFWDYEDCATSMKGHSYICKRPYNDIGCISGKGQQYVGKANVTASGKPCLFWGDNDISYPLRIIVPNHDLRQKLKSHNYCRNPNPSKDSRPWCFTGPSIERENCDIPQCKSIGSTRTPAGGKCKKSQFECSPNNCIPVEWVCDGESDCPNGEDEFACARHLNDFKKIPGHRLIGYDVEKWMNMLPNACALRCKEADFTCRSFSHKSEDNSCLLSGDNLDTTGALNAENGYDYYEMTSRKINCDDMFICDNKKCINQTKVCNGKNDCGDRSDENICTAKNLDYGIRLGGSDNNYEGRVEVKVFGHWGQVCDDGFGMIDAEVICKELGFYFGALEVRPGGFFGNLDPPTRFMVDQLRCRGNETSLRECDFDGWGVHNCQPEEAVGIVCKTAVSTCEENHWKCDNSPTCISTRYICDEVDDCPDGSDESPVHCEAPFEIRLVNGSNPFEGRVEIRHHGVWGTICDDDFSHANAKVICNSIGYGGSAIAKKNGFFGSGTGPIWLDDVTCRGNETQLYHCEHKSWGIHNCNHDEDAGVICGEGTVNYVEPNIVGEKRVDIRDILPSDCGKRPEDFTSEDDIFTKVVKGSIAPKDSYPWQASIRVRGQSRSNHWCGAVVISPLHVLTAAHCLEGYNKGTYFVRAGDYNTERHEGTEAEANIEDYYIHEEFRKGTRINNDIALVLLKGRGLELGQHIMPICLPQKNTEYPSGLNCTISGFGSIDTGRSSNSNDLRFGWIPLIDQNICRADYVYGKNSIKDGMVCAGYLEEGIDSCDGDSGGPLSCPHNGAFTLFGITSWGQHCGKINKPGVYVRISYYRDWIDRKIIDSLTGR